MCDVQDVSTSQTNDIVGKLVTNLKGDELQSTECTAFSEEVPEEI